MDYPAATGQGTPRPDATLARDLAPTAFGRRDSCSSRSTGMGFGLFLSVRRASHGAAGERERRGSRRLTNTGRCALTTSRKNGPPAAAMFSLAP